ncbi:N-acetylmuramoyl-L-alanine amidase [Pseudogracilibacillus auburnensis]|uniref:N-acetylmuramoyl-L-alanine amidase n=1 Tax=Pseudogracilibacillus auburnensis TaxID=1494959 RepID=UPI001A96888D|nr:N-acetylmuramoyl-L-alanine amidase [Pseudogracilibacillus auburnensis]MBO1003164.1 N-acetylmuramoyl-L-alanine amidase [Pseudogracilibacillus auburnensis]
MAKIFIDPGHGGSDPGAVGNGLREKDLTLDISKRIKKYLDDNFTGHIIRMSRTGDTTLSLTQRANSANSWGADILVSVHINAGRGTGYEDYIFNGNVSSKTINIRNTIHAEISKELGNVRNRGKKRANFAVLRQTKMPAILTENLFIDTKADADKLKSNAYLNRIAKGHAEGIAKAFNLKPKSKPVPKPTPKPSSNTFYRVVAGSYNDRKNADNQVNKLKKLGVDGVFIDVFKK